MTAVDVLHARPHRRLNPLTGEWVLVSPQRMDRPWLGQVDRPPKVPASAYDRTCYLCPGNPRAGGQRNPDYASTYVFTNDFPALVPEMDPGSGEPHALLRAESQPGTCRVVCFSPRHDLTLAELPAAEIGAVIDTWAEQTAELGRRYAWVQVFENKGELMGASNPHPHGQVWASGCVPSLPTLEEANQAAYHAARGSCLLVDYAAEESQRAERVVAESDGWLAVVPFWAVWPFETLLLPRRSVARLPDLAPADRTDLAGILKRLLVGYDNLFGVPFPYSMGWHGAPFGRESSGWQLHAHFYPPLLRSAEVRKFLVGYEMLAEPQRDLTPEAAAEWLRGTSETRFSERTDGSG